MLLCMALTDTPEEKSRFEQLYEEYKSLMYRIAYKILRNEHDAEDAVQEAFISIAKNIDKFSDADCHKTQKLIVIITENKAIDIYRSHRHRQGSSFDEEYMGVVDKSVIEQSETRHDLAKAMALLPEQWGDVLQLRYVMGYSVRETAQLLSISEANVRKIAECAKKRLEETL